VKIAKKILFLIFLSTTGLHTSAHPFYVSICKVDFNKQNHSLEISLKVFADDLISGLKNAGVPNLYLGEEKENENTDTYIFDYLKSVLSFSVNDKKRLYTFIGKEMEADVVWIYLEITDISELNKITTDCKLLTEVYETQNNIFQIRNGDEIKNMLLTKKKQTGTIMFM